MKEQLLQTGYTWGRQVVLRCQARYPQLEAGELPGFEGVLSQYYAAYARDKINNLARGWYPAACASCRRMGPYGGFSPLEAQCEYTVMYNRGGYYSAFFDTYVRQDGLDLAAGRQSGVFWTGAGRMVPLSALFRPGYPYRQVILRCVQEETARQAGSGDLLSPPSLGAFFHRAPVLSYPLRRLRQRIGARTIEAEGAPFYPRKFLHQAGGAGPRSFEGTKPLCQRGISALWLRPGAGAQESDSPARRASVGLLRPWPGLADGRGNVV